MAVAAAHAAIWKPERAAVAPSAAETALQSPYRSHHRPRGRDLWLCNMLASRRRPSAVCACPLRLPVQPPATSTSNRLVRVTEFSDEMRKVKRRGHAKQGQGEQARGKVLLRVRGGGSPQTRCRTPGRREARSSLDGPDNDSKGRETLKARRALRGPPPRRRCRPRRRPTRRTPLTRLGRRCLAPP